MITADESPFFKKRMKQYAHIIHDVVSLSLQKRMSIDAQNLKSYNYSKISTLFLSEDLHKEWGEWRQHLERVRPGSLPGGVNPGDERALYYLIRQLRPRHVLEIGTHIGASTVNIASALKKNSLEQARAQNSTEISPPDFHLTTVDQIDVNSTTTRNWLKYGAEHSPLDLLKKLELERFVTFKACRSVDFLKDENTTFDLIFLDGNHSAHTVYHEMPLALKRLNQDGVVVLHDYFPKLQPLWSDGSMIPGPFLALKKLQARCPKISVTPLGVLPWQTKYNSNVTSIALVLKKS